MSSSSPRSAPRASISNTPINGRTAQSSEAHDKLGFESVAPLSKEARAELDRYLVIEPLDREAPLFPATTDAKKGVRKSHADYWLRRAVSLAELPKLERGAWHSFRRQWASERRHLPAQDVAAAGGWR